MICPSIYIVGLFIQAMVQAISVTVGNEDGRNIVRYNMRICPVILVITFSYSFERLPIPIIPYDLAVFVRVVLQGFNYRVLDYSFRTSAKGNYISGCLLSFLYIRVRSNCNDHARSFSIFRSNDYVRLGNYGEFERTYARVSILITYPSIKRTMSLGNCQISGFSIQVVNGIPVRDFFRIRRSDNFNFEGDMALGTTSFNYHRFSISTMVFRRCLMVSYHNAFILVKGFKMGAWQDFYFFVERNSKRRESIVWITYSHAEGINVTRSNGDTVKVGVSKSAIPTKGSIIQAGLCRTRESLYSKVNVANRVNSSG